MQIQLLMLISYEWIAIDHDEGKSGLSQTSKCESVTQIRYWYYLK